MNVRMVVMLALIVVLAGCLGWESGEQEREPIVDLKTDADALGYDDATPDLSEIDTGPPTPVAGDRTPEPTATPAPTAVTDTPDASTDTVAGTSGAQTGASTPGETATDTTPTETTTTPTETTTPTATATETPDGETPTSATDDSSN